MAFRARVKVRDVDRGWKALARDLRGIRAGRQALVGIQGSKGAQSREGVTNIQLGVVHEFGVPERSIPERSFLRFTFDRERRRYLQLLSTLAAKAVDDPVRDFEGALEIVAEKATADVKNSIIQRKIKQDLKAATILQRVRQGLSPGPALHATGDLMRSITWVIRGGL